MLTDVPELSISRDGTIDDWSDFRAEASRAHNRRTASYLLAMPLLSNHLEDALSQFGISCDDAS